MSFDDLPPGSKPPQANEDVASSAAQAPSGQDAPPAAGTRRRRAKPAGTVAASSPVTAETSPANRGRKQGTRRKQDTTPVSLPTAEPVKSASESSDTPLAGAEAPGASRRRNRTSGHAKPPVSLDSAIGEPPPLSGVSAEQSDPDALKSEPSAPPGRRRRTAPKASPTAVPDSSPDPQAHADATPILPGAPQRRARRTRASATTPVAQPDSETPPITEGPGPETVTRCNHTAAHKNPRRTRPGPGCRSGSSTVPP